MLKLKKAILLSALISPVIGNALSVEKLNDSFCSSVVTPTSRGAYLISRPLSQIRKAKKMPMMHFFEWPPAMKQRRVGSKRIRC